MCKLLPSHFLGGYTMNMKNAQLDMKHLHLQKYQIPISLGYTMKVKNHELGVKHLDVSFLLVGGYTMK